MVRATLQVMGQVQGVNFRSSTKAEADILGSVEVVIEGPKEAAQQLIDWCYHGPVWARVEGLTVEWLASSGEFSEFKVSR